jgi:hypothetical protein
MRLIDADLVVEKAVKIINKSLDSDFLEDRLVADEVALFLAEFIDSAQTVDAEPVRHVKWVLDKPDEYGNRKPKCSVCGEYHLYSWSDYTRCNYCPHCGAKMDGD